MGVAATLKCRRVRGEFLKPCLVSCRGRVWSGAIEVQMKIRHRINAVSAVRVWSLAGCVPYWPQVILLPRVLLPAVLTAGLLAIPHAQAFDGNSAGIDEKAPLQIFKNPKAALRAGLEGVRSGHARSALAALEYAAEGGESLAQWKLGKMYADGDGVPHDDAKAFEYFSQIVENYDEDDADPRQAPFVSSAFVALGVYNLNGISASGLAPNTARALEMFHYAAVNFGDSNAQYNLARMYLDGNGTPKDGRQAARWLFLAADKGHIESQALLGQMLFTGHEGVQKQRARGLMWLTLAHDGVTDKVKDQWILDLYAKATSAASDDDRQVASLYVDERLKRHN